MPAAQSPGRRGGTLFVRAHGEPEPLASRVKLALQSLDPTLPFVRVEPLDARLRPERIPWEVSTVLFVTFGWLAALIAAGGMFSVVSFLMAQRTRELAVRSALGATRRAIFQLVVGHGLSIAALGIGIGCLCAFWVSRLFAARLVGVSSSEPLIYLGVALLIVLLTVFASYLPGRRASRIDPMVVLRRE